MASPPTSRSRRHALALAALVIVPLLLAALTADILLLLRERRVLKPMGSPALAAFQSETRLRVLKLRNGDTAVYPFTGPAEYALRRYPEAEPQPVLFPLGGISTTSTLLCTTNDSDVRYMSDEHGFDNPPGLWTVGSLELALIGDSFVHGMCVGPENQIATQIRRHVPRTLNLGVMGAGPLMQLAILREYAAPLRPKRVLWFFYEGNDIEDLAREKVSPLAAYLGSAYSQRLLTRQDTIDMVLRKYTDSALAAEVRLAPLRDELPTVLLLPRVRAALGFVAANAPGMSTHPEYPTFERVLKMAKREVAAWGGAIVLVYLPDYHRFDTRVVTFIGWVHNNNEVHRRAMAAAHAAGMPVIDVSSAFAADPNPRRFWPSPVSHYGPEGYELVVRTVLSALSVPPG